MISKTRLIKLTQRLIRINSENPPGDERAVASFVAATLKGMGFSPRVYEFSRRRPNVAAVFKGVRGGKALLVTPHLDTVPAGRGWAHGPFSADVSGNRIYGRGASDCKGNLAVLLEVFRSLREDRIPLKHDIIFLATCDEETGSAKGLIPILRQGIFRPSSALILDSDEFNIITAQKGLIHFKVKVSGKKAHGAYPERGVNAIDTAVSLIGALKTISFVPEGRKHSGTGIVYRPHPLLKAPTVNIGTIRGGDKVNMVADWCEFEADIRFLPGMKAGKILVPIKRIFRKIAGGSFRLEVNDIQQPYEIGIDHPMVASLKKAARGIVKASPVKGSEGATVITFFKGKNIPAVATGYGASGSAHGTDEFIRIPDLYRGALVLEKFIKIFDSKRP